MSYYDSDNDSYHYSSDSDNDNEEFNYFEDNFSDLEEKRQINDINSIYIDDIKIVPIDVLNSIDKKISHYNWVVTCLKIYYNINNELLCNYNINDHLSLYLKNKTHTFKLFIKDSKITELSYPYIPFQIKYIGNLNNIDLYDNLQIIKNNLLIPSNWNICTNIFTFVQHIIYTLNKYDSDVIIDTNNNVINKSISNITNVINLNFQFADINALPQFGININSDSKNKSTYSWKGSDKCNSLNELIFKDINVLNDNIEIIKQSESYSKIIYLILDNLLSVKLTKLEISINQEFYNFISNIIKNTDYNFNTDIFNDENKLELNELEQDKLKFVDDFLYHEFKNKSTVISSKLTKRIFSEIDNIIETIKDFDCYVLVSEANVCLFKLLFIPDSETPYAYGMFEFDLYIPGDYPNSPPSVKFLTTGNGKVRFNPNLYNCGKVCLSIINTWSTPQWSPKSSTISQIILSISSMIFNEHPITNEPVWYDILQTEAGLKKSQDYNKKIKAYTLQYGINVQISNTSTPFKDIIKEIYNKNKDKIQSHY
jgi:baculoviral IAP repeat-containing protein 6